MPWDLDVADKSDFVVRRPARQLAVSGPGDESLQVIDLPALALRKSEVSPEWLAAETKEPT